MFGKHRIKQSLLQHFSGPLKYDSADFPSEGLALRWLVLYLHGILEGMISMKIVQENTGENILALSPFAPRMTCVNVLCSVSIEALSCPNIPRFKAS